MQSRILNENKEREPSADNPKARSYDRASNQKVDFRMI